MSNVNNDFASIEAKDLQKIVEALRDHSMMVIDKVTNQGLLIDYEALANQIISQVMSPSMSDDGLKLMVVDRE